MLSNHPSYEEMMVHIERASALTNFAISTRFSELDDITIFGYFETLSEELVRIKLLASDL